MRFAVAGVCAVLAGLVLLGSGSFQAGEKKAKAKYTIKEVMKIAHGGGEKSLRAKVLSGSASDEEKMKLVDLYTSLSQNEPRKGEVEAWKKKTTGIARLANAAAKGDEKALKQLAKATTCAACHKEFK